MFPNNCQIFKIRVSFKIILVLTGVFLLYGTGKAQSFKCFVLKGYIKGATRGQIELSDRYGNDPNLKVNQKKVGVINGKFEFTGKIAYPFSVYLTYYNNQSKIFTHEFYIDAGKQFFTTDTASFALKYDLLGSEIHTEYLNNYLPAFTGVNSKIKEWADNYEKLADRLQRDSAGFLHDSLEIIRRRLNNMSDSVFYSYACKNKRSYLILWELDSRLGQRYSDYYEKSYAVVNKRIRASRIGDSVLMTIKALKKTRIGAHLSDMPLLDTSGLSVNLSFKPAKKNKYLFVDLWYSNCAPCIAQLPELRIIHSKYADGGFEMVSISAIEKKGKDGWLNAIHRYQLSWPQYFDSKMAFIYQLRILNFPSNFLIDGNGTIIARNLAPAQLNNYLFKRLAYNK